jgi:hypothetical protein
MIFSKILSKIKNFTENPIPDTDGDFLWKNDIIVYYPNEKVFVKEEYLVWTFQEFCEALIYSKIKECISIWGDYWLYFYSEKELAVLTISRYYRKYRYNLYKKRNDLLKRDLTAYFYHPSRLSFFID